MVTESAGCYDFNILLVTGRGGRGVEKEFALYRGGQRDIHYHNNKRIQEKTKWMLPVKYREASMCAA